MIEAVDIRHGDESPQVAGWYVAWLHLAARPVVLWWSARDAGWRQGAQLVRVDRWAGPLPERTWGRQG